MSRRRSWVLVLAGLLVIVVLAGCERPGPPAAAGGAPPRRATAAPGKTLALGDVDPGDPVGRAKRIRPLADFLAASLKEPAITAGSVVVAHDISELARLMREGKVDLQLSSPVPILRVQEVAGTSILLRRWVGEAADYWSVFFVRQDQGIADLSGLKGKVLALKDPSSTSSCLLPAAHLVERGYRLRQVARVSEPVGADEVGLFYTGSEQNVFEAVLKGLLPVGAISNQEYDELPAQLRGQLAVVDRTVAVPRALVAVRAGLDPRLVQRIDELLLGLTDTDRQALAAQDGPLAWTWRFDRLTPEAESILARVAALTKGVGGG